MASLTKKKLLEETAYKNDGRLRMLFDNTNEHAICMLDDRGQVISWNMSAENMTGYSSSDMISKDYAVMFSADEQKRKVPAKTLALAAKKSTLTDEGIRIRKDGSHFWARSFLTLVKKSSRGANFFVLIMQDITLGRKRDQLREKYIGIASHELKNPITTLSLYSELLEKRLALDGDERNLQMLRDIQGQVTRLVSLVDDLLIVSKIGGDRLQPRKEDFSPDTLLKKIIHDFQYSNPTHRIHYTSAGVRLVRADKNLITQVLINLLTNALKYSPQSNKIYVRIMRKNGKCLISVQDFGIGIAKKDQKEIFSRFFRTDTTSAGNVAGSGLGLYISKEIMKKHRERLYVESVEGKGSTFFFTLPTV